MAGQAIWWDIATESPNKSSTSSIKAPFTGSFRLGLELLTLAYRTDRIYLYELQTHEWIAWVVDENSRNATYLVSTQLRRVLVQSQEPEINASLQSLLCSPDCRTFGTVDAQGNPGIWDFESLTVLYDVPTPTSSFRTLGFTSDGLNLIDVVDQEMRIWAPSALIRKTIEEKGSISEQASTLSLRGAISHQETPILVAGNHNGDIISHPNSVVKCLALSKSDNIASSHTKGPGVMQVWQLNTSQSSIINTVKLGFQAQFEAAICQISFDGEGRYLLVTTRNSDLVYEVAVGTIVGLLSFHADERRIWKWICLPAFVATGSFGVICDGKVVLYSIATFPSKMVDCQIKLQLKADDGFAATATGSIAANSETSSLILDVHQHRGYITSSTLVIFQRPELFNPRQVTMNVQPVRVLLIFLHKNSWACSIKLLTPTDRHHIRHLFVLNEFTTRASDTQPLYTRNKVLIFTLHDKFAVIKNLGDGATDAH
ncbi:WD40-repeat-containing domain protein [Xylariaceae sp. AK1471]|nr:WD40-repeat-containing domain protein [Xylariaceae sp. AK1471]